MDIDKFSDRENAIDSPKDEEIFLNNEKVKAGLKIFGAGALLGLSIYGLAFLGLGYFHPHYLLKAILAFVFTLIILFGVQISMGSPATRMQAAILGAVFIVFTITILIGYNEDVEHGRIVITSSETGNLNSVGGIWFTDKVFSIGQTVKFEVLYNNVKMKGGRIFSPGVYTFPENGKGFQMGGCLMFEGMVDKPAQVKVIY